MTTLDEDFRPYAAPANVIAVFARARTRNLPESINNDFLRLADIPEAVYGRVMQALKFLGMVKDDSSPSDTLRAIASAPEAQYKELLAGAIRTAYSQDFERVDPDQDPQPKILDAFSPYQPRSQTLRMVILFLGLCREAGIAVLDVPRNRKMQTGKEGRTTPRRHHGLATTRTIAMAAPTPQGQDSSVVFGISDEDLAALDEQTFKDVWDSLGKVMQARAKIRTEKAKKPLQAADEESAEGASGK